ncbi:MAG TPA: UGSC family (seleno)protein [Candidatus Dormibacteraeota bacterium]|nr:UGSC family (seleno)protein [Candidatus Dormibacteraeota bacterium]
MSLRFSFTPYPVVGQSAARLREYVDGNDPVSGKPFVGELIDALTSPLTSEEKKPAARPFPPPRSRVLEADTEENLQRLFIENGWTDGLPIVLPTEDRVAEMLEGTSHAPDEIVGKMAVAHRGEYTSYMVEKVAINAVMAGARPEHFPVILAIASTGHPAFPSSTTSFAGMVIVNGPIRGEIAMNAGLGALSPFNFANAVIGRAWTLMSINLGNARLGDTLLASTGHNLNYNNMCCAENEESSVWEPFHVEKGFRGDESVVSIFRGWSVINSMGAANSIRPANEETAIMLKAFSALHSVATLVMDPLVAKGLKEQGFQTKQDVARWLSENTKIPASQYWAADVIYAFNRPVARAGVEPFATWANLPPDTLIAPYNDPKGINIVVVGGESNPLWLTTDFRYVTSASVDKWRPKGGLKRDARPIRMPAGLTCSDGLCGIPS